VSGSESRVVFLNIKVLVDGPLVLSRAPYSAHAEEECGNGIPPVGPSEQISARHIMYAWLKKILIHARTTKPYLLFRMVADRSFRSRSFSQKVVSIKTFLRQLGIQLVETLRVPSSSRTQLAEKLGS
jgi:hypothetical protein